MSLADFSDANRHLDGTKLTFVDNADAAPDALYADRLIRAALFDLYGADEVNSWDINPSAGQKQTPQIIREAASFLMAAHRYARIYSEASNNVGSYYGRLRAEYNDIIEGLRDGTLQLADDEIDTSFSEDTTDFWPNDSDVNPDTGEENRFARMDQEF